MTHNQSTSKPKKISVVTPIYNEEKNIDEFISQVESVFRELSYDHEIICVNDGSNDASYDRILYWVKQSPRVKAIDLARNFGKEMALSAGLDYATGDAVIIMDADLQHPPALIRNFLEKWEEGFDGVYGIRAHRREETRTKQFLTRTFYKLLQSVSEVSIPPNAGDFRLLDRCIVDALLEMPERTRFMKGLYAWVGFNQIGVDFEAGARMAGESKWSMLRLWSLALEGLVSFSSVPLKVWSYMGFIISMLSLIYAAIVVIDVLVTGSEVPGIPSILTAVFFIGGIQLLTVGILGEYLSRIFIEVKRRPVYIVREICGVDMNALRALKEQRTRMNLRAE